MKNKRWSMSKKTFLIGVLVVLSSFGAGEGFLLTPNVIPESTLRLNRYNAQNERPGSELFPGKGPYVPSGLSPEEYSRIKKQEEEKLKKMNFAAWGPRFKQSDAPDGDWMVIPSLWTNGFNARSRVSNADSSSRKRIAALLLSETLYFLRSRFAPFLLAWLLVDTLFSAFSIFRLSSLTGRQAASLILRVPTLDFGLTTASAIKKIAIKTFTSAALVPAASKTLEKINRKRLWSNRRIILYSLAGSVSILAGLAIGRLLVGPYVVS